VPPGQPASGAEETAMNEDIFNTSIRRFLKTLGVTAQREIEKAVREALKSLPPRLPWPSARFRSRTRSAARSSLREAERVQQKWSPVLRGAIKLAQIA
jgi:hypothetical protein